MEIIVYGTGANGRSVFELLHERYIGDYVVKGFADSARTGFFCGLPICQREEIPQGSRVIIAVHNFEDAAEICASLKTMGIQDIWWFETTRTILGRSFFDEQCVDCTAWNGIMLKQAEMHVMDACNLNCRGCTHFSPVFSRKIPSLRERINDVKKLKTKFSHVAIFYILGGEPFLNPEIGEYARSIREILPDSDLRIVTNGLLIPNLTDDILRKIHDHSVHVSISEYVPTHKIIDKICSRLNNFDIVYDIRKIDNKQKFNIPLAKHSDMGYSRRCMSDGCVTIWNGSIARCPTLMYVGMLNQKFNVNFPQDGIISLDSDVNGEVLKDKLNKCVPLCDYCVDNEIDWTVCGTDPRLTDFVAIE